MEASCRQLTAHSDLPVCSAGSQKEVSQHQRVFIRAEEVPRLGGITFNKRSTFFFCGGFFFLCLCLFFVQILFIMLAGAESGADIYNS